MPPRCAGSSSRTASAAPHARDPLRPDPATGPEPSAPCVVPRLPRVAIDRPCPAPPIRRPHRISPPNVGQAAGVCLVLFGLSTRWAAIVLFGFCLLTALFFH